MADVLDPLYNVRKKIERAERQVEELDAEIKNFLDTEPWTFRRDVEPDYWQVYRAVVHRHPPGDLGIIVGDIAHNLRSSLDHLVWQLVLQNRRLPSGRNQFPILTTSRAWDEIIERKPAPPGERKLQSRKWLKGVGRKNQSLVKSVQPFWKLGAAKYEPLTQLQWLNNFDKHRTIHAGYGYVGEPKLTMLSPGITLVDGISPQIDSRIEEGVEMLRVRARDESTGEYATEMDMHLSFPVGIAFGEWKRPLGATLFSTERLAGIAFYLRLLLDHFEHEAFDRS